MFFKGIHQQFGSMDACTQLQTKKKIIKKKKFFYLNPIDWVLLEPNMGFWAVLDTAS